MSVLVRCQYYREVPYLKLVHIRSVYNIKTYYGAIFGERFTYNWFFSQVDEAVEAASKIGYPVMVRAAYALGGLGSGLCENEEKLRQTTEKVPAYCLSKFIS